MTNATLAHQRLFNQRISTQPFDRPDEVVQWLVAAQAQDFAGAKWALGLRLRAATDASVEQQRIDVTIDRLVQALHAFAGR